MIALIIVLAVVLGFLGITFWFVLRTDQNEGPTLGTNHPYPDGLLGGGGDEPPFLPTPVISDREMFLRDADRRLTELQRHSHPQAASTSWMDEPGAMEAAGLADEPEQPDDAGGRADTPDNRDHG